MSMHVTAITCIGDCNHVVGADLSACAEVPVLISEAPRQPQSGTTRAKARNLKRKHCLAPAIKAGASTPNTVLGGAGLRHGWDDSG